MIKFDFMTICVRQRVSDARWVIMRLTNMFYIVWLRLKFIKRSFNMKRVDYERFLQRGNQKQIRAHDMLETLYIARTLWVMLYLLWK